MLLTELIRAPHHGRSSHRRSCRSTRLPRRKVRRRHWLGLVQGNQRRLMVTGITIVAAQRLGSTSNATRRQLAATDRAAFVKAVAVVLISPAKRFLESFVVVNS